MIIFGACINDVLVAQSLSHVWHFVTPWAAACQVSLSFTIFQSLLKFMCIELMMPSKSLILCCPLLFLVAPSFPCLTQIIQQYFIWEMLIKHLQWTWSWIELSHEYVQRWNYIALRKLIICIPSRVYITSNITLAVWKGPSWGICNILMGKWSHHFVANRWGNSGNSDRLYFLGSKITADGDCSHEIKRHFLLGRKVMTNLDSILKSRDITLPTKVHLVKAMIFPVVMYGCESCTVKKAESQRIDAFELWCWRRLLTVPFTSRRSNQSILKEISPEYSLEGLMLKLKLQYFGHLMGRTDLLERPWCWEILKAGGEGDDRGWDCWMAPPIQRMWVWVNSCS